MAWSEKAAQRTAGETSTVLEAAYPSSPYPPNPAVRYRPVGDDPEKGPKNNQRDGAHLL